jgi:multimeric flavodoxin WrbA
MKLVAVNGSPHGTRGGTARIAGWLFDAVRREGCEVIEHHLADLAVELCRGCGRCMGAGTCAADDDLPRVHESIASADLIAFCSPTYVFQVTGLMKTFIDRTAALIHRPPLEGKYGVVVTSSAGMGETKVIRYLDGVLSLLGAGVVGAVWGTYRPPTRLWEPDAVKERAARLGRELVLAAREGRVYPLSDEVIAERRFLRELIRQNRRIMKKDHEYWTERGWYDDLPGTRKPRGSG